MATCAQCGRDFQPHSETQMICEQCLTPPYVPAQPEPKRPRVPLSFYLHSPTVWLIAINVLMYLVTGVASHSISKINNEVLLRFGANFGILTLGGQPWRLLTCTFLHGDFLHILLNMWALLNLGILAEILFGRRSFLGMYFISGLAASIVSVSWHFHTGNPSIFTVGASGAIFGIAGALIPALALQKNARLRTALSGNLVGIVIFVVYTVAYGFREAHIDNSAHLGGLACGLILGVALPSSPGGDEEEHYGRRLIIFAVAITATLTAFVALQKSEVGVLEYARAQSAYQKKDLNGAVEHLHQSLKNQPRFVDSHFLLGLIYLQQGKNEQAKSHLLAATKIAPDWSEAHSKLCIAYLQMRDLPNALASCQRAVELDPKDPDKQINLGLIQRANEDLPGALESFGKAEQLRPNGFDEEAMLGESLVDAGRTDEAIIHLRLALKAKPDDQHVRMLLAQLLLSRGDREEARKVLGK
jgi:membrane associated rhomboid family serine protease/Flp pilus assembly protein TadD